MSTPAILKTLFMAAACAAAVSAGAQPAPDTGSTPSRNVPQPLSETLKNIPAAGAACLKEDFEEKKGTSARAPERKADPGCAVALAQLSDSLRDPETVLVDVRSRTAFDSMHIDGAINLSAAEVRTKRYLLNKPLILVGDGKAEQELYALCSELKSAGFRQTRVLRGGMIAWLLENRPVIGTAPKLAEVASINPGELFQESKVAGNIVVGLSGGRKLADVLPMTQPGFESIDALQAFLQKRKKTKGLHNIIVVADERVDRDQLSRLGSLAGSELLLFYSGAENEYRQFLRIQNAMWAKQAKGPVRPRCGVL